MSTTLKHMVFMVAAVFMVATPLFEAQARPSRVRPAAKYVFFFLGDGMASVQMQATEAYLVHEGGGDSDNAADMMNPVNILNMNKLPYQGMSTTFADTRFITGSAAAATAFACGVKTDIGVIGKDTTKSINYKSIAELAQEQGKAIGILSSVSLPHATPAAYYANVNHRSDYLGIGYQASQSGFDFFGGGKFRRLNQEPVTPGVTLEQEFLNAGYVFVDTIAAAQAQLPGQKVICSVPFSPGSDAMPYHVDKPDGNFTLAEVTQVAIDRLKSDPEGFFIMVEGGKIDWACHANDAMGAIGDTIDFDNAVGVAMDFLKVYPNETLVVVTGDHECGGMVLGYGGKGYGTSFEVLLEQENSFEHFDQNDLPTYTAATPYADAGDDIDAAMKALILDNFGIDYDALTDYQKELLEKAYDRTMERHKLYSNPPQPGEYPTADTRDHGFTVVGTSSYDGGTTAQQVDYLTYGGYEPLTIALTHLLNQKSGIAWTSYSHTGVPVPVLAGGFEAWRFNGFYDNTDIAKKLGQAMRTPNLPVVAP